MPTAHSLLRSVFTLLDLTRGALQFLLFATHSGAALKAENIVLHKQLALDLQREAKLRRAAGAIRKCVINRSWTQIPAPTDAANLRVWD